MFRFNFLLSWLVILVLLFPSSFQAQNDLMEKRHVQPNDLQFYNQGSRSSLSYLYQKRDEMFEIQLNNMKNKKQYKYHTHEGSKNGKKSHNRHYIVNKKEKTHTTKITSETTEFPEKEIQELENSKEGWQLNLGMYVDKGIKMELVEGSSCESEEEDDKKKKFFIFADDSPDGIKELVSNEDIVQVFENDHNLLYDQKYREQNSSRNNYTSFKLFGVDSNEDSGSKCLGYGIFHLCIWIFLSLI